jgi:hypothetical protein
MWILRRYRDVRPNYRMAVILSGAKDLSLV